MIGHCGHELHWNAFADKMPNKTNHLRTSANPNQRQIGCTNAVKLSRLRHLPGLQFLQQLKLRRLSVWLNLDEKIGHKRSPHFRQNTPFVWFKLRLHHHETNTSIFWNKSDLKTWISGVMMVKMEARWKAGWRRPAALLRVLEKTDAWPRWEQDKKVEGKGWTSICGLDRGLSEPCALDHRQKGKDKKSERY